MSLINEVIGDVKQRRQQKSLPLSQPNKSFSGTQAASIRSFPWVFMIVGLSGLIGIKFYMEYRSQLGSSEQSLLAVTVDQNQQTPNGPMFLTDEVAEAEVALPHLPEDLSLSEHVDDMTDMLNVESREAMNASVPEVEPEQNVMAETEKVHDIFSDMNAAGNQVSVFDNPSVKGNLKGTFQKNSHQAQRALSDGIVEKAKTLVRLGEFESAENILKDALKINPKAKLPRTTLARLYLDTKQLKKATLLLKEGILAEPSYGPYAYLMARVYATLEDYDQAIRLLETGEFSDKEGSEKAALLAALYQKNHQYDKAAQMYQQLLALNPKQGQWWLGLGLALESQSAWQYAANSYYKALSVSSLDDSLQRFVHKRLSVLSERNGTRPIM